MAFELLSRLACSDRRVGHLWLILTVLMRYTIIYIEAREGTPLRRYCCSVREIVDRAVAQSTHTRGVKSLLVRTSGYSCVDKGNQLLRFHFVVARALIPSGLGC